MAAAEPDPFALAAEADYSIPSEGRRILDGIKDYLIKVDEKQRKLEEEKGKMKGDTKNFLKRRLKLKRK